MGLPLGKTRFCAEDYLAWESEQADRSEYMGGEVFAMVGAPEREAQRGAFIEHLLSMIPVLDFSLPVARTYARMLAALPKNLTAGAHDALISP